MIAIACLPALLLAQASDSVRARGPVASSSVSVEGARVRVEPLLGAVGGTAQRLANGHWMLALAGHAIELVEGVPYARLGDRYVSIAGAPSRARDGSLLVPVQVVAELLPALG
ncbi:MAG: hypothetical protein K2X99_01480, partial [Gemmatimonadaceae bacterium]|nr:hypothetical protein [Gemmatimonadaceae bacterium]